MITKPLARLTKANKSIDLENVETFKNVHLGIRQKENELAILEETFNKMVQRLAMDRRDLDRINQNLEFEVEQRTHQLQKTNDQLKEEIVVRKNTEKELTLALSYADFSHNELTYML